MTDTATNETIDRETLRQLLDTEAPVTVLDIRKVEDRAEWSIPGSMHVDAYAALNADDTTPLDGLDLPIDRPIVTVCGAGKTSLLAMRRLRERGYDARSLTDGMQGWSLAWNTAEVPVFASAATVLQVRRTGKGCLSYLLGSEGEAVVIDASLDPGVYLDLAAQRGWRITQVIDTHVHADHVSRARVLARHTGATLRLPMQDRVTYPFVPLRDGDTVTIGRATLAAIATPGHTMESMSFLLDEAALFTGDTLFLGAVGRPDLEASADESRLRARHLHRSLRRLAALPGPTVVLPGHTSRPVAFDGLAIAAPLGDVRDGLPLLTLAEDDFVAFLLSRIPPTPPNHAAIVDLNEAGTVPDGALTALEAGANRCAIA
jgi:glyoxylase-like metal-dependent hydrolase (beta-lactamase superfamily II)